VSTWRRPATPPSSRAWICSRLIPAADYPVIQGIILVIVVLYLVVNLLVDISYRLLDPRVELA
jgi:ABC-type dipeptide/oligopeptide/nickel transport system permease component